MFPKAMVVSALRAGCGGHGTIIIAQACPAIATEVTVPGSIARKWRKLAQKTPECRDTPLRSISSTDVPNGVGTSHGSNLRRWHRPPQEMPSVTSAHWSS